MAMNPGLAAFIAKKKGGKSAPPKKGEDKGKGNPADKLRSDKLKQFAGADFSKGK